MTHPAAQPRRGMSLIEMMVVIAIIGILASLVLPAIGSARESSRRMQCSSQMRQIVIGITSYESSYKRLPPGGKGIDQQRFNAFLKDGTTEFIMAGRFLKYGASQGVNNYDVSPSFMLAILPTVDATSLYNKFDFRYEYMDKRPSVPDASTKSPGIVDNDISDFNERFGNVRVSRSNIEFYRCPSNYLKRAIDPFGYGRTDYFTPSHTDINPGNDQRSDWPAAAGVRNRRSTMEGALALHPVGLGTVSDGASNTIVLMEASGRTHIDQEFHTGSDRPSPTCDGRAGNNAFGYGCAPATAGGSNAIHYTVHRWADSEAAAAGVSGPPLSDAAAVPRQFINNNSQPPGGPKDGSTTYGRYNCPWSVRNCGPNNEPFSFHGDGINVGLLDGSVHYLQEGIDPQTLRYMITRNEQQQVRVSPFDRR